MARQNSIGGPVAGTGDSSDGVPPEIPVDLYVPGCPPHPVTILDGLLRLLGRIAREPGGGAAADGL